MRNTTCSEESAKCDFMAEDAIVVVNRYSKGESFPRVALHSQ